MDDLLREFLTETNESLDVADVELVKFEQEPNNAAILNNIFRLVHTIKGTCGFIGLPRLAKLAHAAETLMDRFREGVPVTPAAVSLVLQTIDRIKEILVEIETEGGREPEGSDADLIERLEAMAMGSAPAASEVPEPAEEETKVTVGTLVDQVLERPLMPGEVPLDELERMFRETEPEAPARTPTSEIETPATKTGPAKAAPADVAEKAKASDEAGPGGGVASQSIRVNVDVLEHLMTMVSELVLTRNQLMEIARRQEDSDFKVSLQRLSTVTGELQEAVMRTRMQPIGSAWQKLPRIVRDLAQDLGKQIELDMVGADTELDRQVLDLIKDPLTHMVRNSADHGLETTEGRRAAGKPDKGVIRLSAYHEGGHIIIEITDDGRGLNTERIRAKVLENHLVTEAELAKMTEAQIHRFIFAAGFSTAEKVTSVSGRGVGMDVVRSNIEQIGGTVDVRSVAGTGSTFVIKIPLTLAIVPALIVEAAGERFAVPQLAVVELVRIQKNSEHRIERIKDTAVLRLRDKLLPITHLGRLLGQTADEGQDDDAFIAVMQVGNQTFGVIVDAVFHTEEIVVKPMSSMLRNIGMFSGSTILGDGRVIMIVDPNGIAQSVATSVEAASVDNEAAIAEQHEGDAEKVALLLFRAGSAEPKAVPLSLVTRLEEFGRDKVESSHDRPLLNYRGSLIPLVFAGGGGGEDGKDTHPMLVFSDNGRTMGFVVDEIVDIVQEPFAIELPSETPGILGTSLVSGRAVEIIDISYYLSVAFPDWFAGRSEESVRGRPRLLLVDGSVFFCNMMEPVLKSVGFDVTVAASVTEAQEAISAGRSFVAILGDAEAPGMDGFVAAVRAHPAHAEAGLIGLAGSSDPYAAGARAGFDHCISKLDRGGLVATVRSYTQPRYGEAA